MARSWCRQFPGSGPAGPAASPRVSRPVGVPSAARRRRPPPPPPGSPGQGLQSTGRRPPARAARWPRATRVGSAALGTPSDDEGTAQLTRNKAPDGNPQPEGHEVAEHRGRPMQADAGVHLHRHLSRCWPSPTTNGPNPGLIWAWKSSPPAGRPPCPI